MPAEKLFKKIAPPIVIVVALSFSVLLAIGESRQPRPHQEREDVVLPPIHITASPGSSDILNSEPRLVIRHAEAVPDTNPISANWKNEVEEPLTGQS